MKIEFGGSHRDAISIARNEKPKRNSPLIDYALAGLDRCWLPEHGRWSHIYHLDGRAEPNESVPQSDVFYTLNVLLGMSRLNQIPASVDVRSVFERNAGQLTRLPVPEYAFGMALWAAAALYLEIPREVRAHVDRLLSDEASWSRLRAQDVGMLLMGLVAQAKIDRSEWYRPMVRLFGFLARRHRGPSGLFFDSYLGFGRRFGTFATQTYLAMACYHYGEFAGDPIAIEAANSCVRKLIALQGPHGEWPWFFDVQRGTVLDFYEVYSVHQHGMAPALLECAERHGVPGATEALARGFKWVLGENQLGLPMLVPELQLSIRSQVRKRELRTKAFRALRALRNAYVPRPACLEDSSAIGLRLECRSYELGWILWSFGARSDLAMLTHHPAFAGALPTSKPAA